MGSGGDNGTPTNAQLYSPDGLLVDRNGDLLIADAGNGLIRKIIGGRIITVAGNRTHFYPGDNFNALSVGLGAPTDLVTDINGNILIADRGANAVRRINVVTGIITTFAGNGSQSYGGDYGLATVAALSGPNVLAVNSSGDVYIGETGNNIVRRVNTSGVISTFAGTPTVSGYTGDGGPATKATLGGPAGLAFDAAGDLLVSDIYFHVIRSITPPPASPVLEVSASSLSFSALQGTAPPPPQTFTVFNNGFAPTSWTLQVQGTNTSWLNVNLTSGTAPSTVVVRASQASLAAGVYRAVIEVASAGALGSPQTITVQLTVGTPDQATVLVTPQLLTFQVAAGGINLAPQPLSISTPLGATASWIATAITVEPNWITLSAPSGSAPSTLWVSVNLKGLAPGTYQGAISIQGNGAATSVTVTLTVSPASPIILLNQRGMQFTAVVGAPAPPPQHFTIMNVGSGVMSWSLSPSSNTPGWLQAGPSSGSSDASNLSNSPVATVLVNPTGLAPGIYTGTVGVQITGTSTLQSVAVTLTVLAAGSTPHTLADPVGLVFVQTDTTGPYTQSVQLFNPGPVSLSATTSTSGGFNWLSVNVPKGSLQGYATLGVQVVTSGLNSSGATTTMTPGVYRGTITLFAGADPYQEIGVLLVIPISAVCTSTFQDIVVTSLPNNFVAPQGQAEPLVARVVDSCGNAVLGSTMTASFDNGEPPLPLIDLRNGQYSNTWNALLPSDRVKVSLQSLNNAFRPTTLDLTGSIPATGAPLVYRSSAVNAATFQVGAPLSPGTIFTVFGGNLASVNSFSVSAPLSTALGGVSLQLSGRNVPLFYAGPGQINGQVPFDAPADASLSLVAISPQGATSSEPVQIVAASPGIFTMNQDGTGQGAVFSAAGVLVDMNAPAKAGDVIQVFCTGLGAVSPEVPSGQPASAGVLSQVVGKVTARIAGQDAVVQFAGLAPGYVGLYQVNVEVPSGIATGNAVGLVLQSNGTDSNTVTIAIK